MNPGVRPGVLSHGPRPTCMVIGCGKKAIYKNPANVTGTGGYCSDHKAYALPTNHSLRARADSLARSIEGRHGNERW